MKFKEIFKVVFSILMVVFILTISMGVNISKMKCNEDGDWYLGNVVPSCSMENEVPSCSIENEVTCKREQERTSRCMKEIKKLCCPEKNNTPCSSETESIQFDFETLLTVFDPDFSVSPILLFSFNLSDCFNANYNGQTYLSDIPPPKLHKPVLSKIQSFLL